MNDISYILFKVRTQSSPAETEEREETRKSVQRVAQWGFDPCASCIKHYRCIILSSEADSNPIVIMDMGSVRNDLAFPNRKLVAYYRGKHEALTSAILKRK